LKDTLVRFLPCWDDRIAPMVCSGNPRRLPRPRRPAAPLGAKCPTRRLGLGAIIGARHRHRQGDAAA
jgi:hypothetical protein